MFFKYFKQVLIVLSSLSVCRPCLNLKGFEFSFVNSTYFLNYLNCIILQKKKLKFQMLFSVFLLFLLNFPGFLLTKL